MTSIRQSVRKPKRLVDRDPHAMGQIWSNYFRHKTSCFVVTRVYTQVLRNGERMPRVVGLVIDYESDDQVMEVQEFSDEGARQFFPYLMFDPKWAKTGSSKTPRTPTSARYKSPAWTA